MWSIKHLRMKKGIFLFLIITVIACNRNRQIESIPVKTVEDAERIGEKYDLGLERTDSETTYIDSHDCRDSEYYIPYDADSVFFDTRYIRVNFHVMDRELRDQNFKEGTGEAETYLPKLLENANMRLRQNFKMNMPAGNETPQLNPRYQYVLVGRESDDDGIYYHYDDELYHFINHGRGKNNYKRDVIRKYAVNSGEVLNIFLTPHHPDSVASKTYKEQNSGIALGTDIKMGCNWGAKRERYWKYATLLNHEIGHVMSLRHAWIRNDGCDDTPAHSRNWKPAENFDDGVTTNNVMDYNASQMAFSPCQIGRVHKVMSLKDSKQRKLVVDDWCIYDSLNTITIDRKVVFNGAKDINKDIIIEDGAYLLIKCRLSMAAEAKIIVQPGGSLELDNCHLHNDCGDTWGGIELQKSNEKTGQLIYKGKVTIDDVYTGIKKE